jgi:hypothetical protein
VINPDAEWLRQCILQTIGEVLDEAHWVNQYEGGELLAVFREAVRRLQERQDDAIPRR